MSDEPARHRTVHLEPASLEREVHTRVRQGLLLEVLPPDQIPLHVPESLDERLELGRWEVPFQRKVRETVRRIENAARTFCAHASS